MQDAKAVAVGELLGRGIVSCRPWDSPAMPSYPNDEVQSPFQAEALPLCALLLAFIPTIAILIGPRRSLLPQDRLDRLPQLISEAGDEQLSRRK
jgi:hypothetical protein